VVFLPEKQQVDPPSHQVALAPLAEAAGDGLIRIAAGDGVGQLVQADEHVFQILSHGRPSRENLGLALLLGVR